MSQQNVLLARNAVAALEVREFRDHGDEVLVAGTFHARGGGSGRTEEEALQAVGLRA